MSSVRACAADRCSRFGRSNSTRQRRAAQERPRRGARAAAGEGAGAAAVERRRDRQPRGAARRRVGSGHARRFRSRPRLLRLADPHGARRQRRQSALRSDDSEARIQVHRAARAATDRRQRCRSRDPAQRDPPAEAPWWMSLAVRRAASVCVGSRGLSGRRSRRSRRWSSRSSSACRSSTTKPALPNTIAWSPAFRISSSSGCRSSIPIASP